MRDAFVDAKKQSDVERAQETMLMVLVKGGLGLLALLVGLVWIGQGLNLILGSPMTGHPQFSVLGLIVAGIGVWLLWSAVRRGITLRAG